MTVLTVTLFLPLFELPDIYLLLLLVSRYLTVLINHVQTRYYTDRFFLVTLLY